MWGVRGCVWLCGAVCLAVCCCQCGGCCMASWTLGLHHLTMAGSGHTSRPSWFVSLFKKQQIFVWVFLFLTRRFRSVYGCTPSPWRWTFLKSHATFFLYLPPSDAQARIYIHTHRHTHVHLHKTVGRPRRHRGLKLKAVILSSYWGELYWY